MAHRLEGCLRKELRKVAFELNSRSRQVCKPFRDFPLQKEEMQIYLIKYSKSARKGGTARHSPFVYSRIQRAFLCAVQMERSGIEVAHGVPERPPVRKIN